MDSKFHRVMANLCKVSPKEFQINAQKWKGSFPLKHLFRNTCDNFSISSDAI